MTFWKGLSPLTRAFIQGVAVGPLVWLFMVGFLLVGGTP